MKAWQEHELIRRSRGIDPLESELCWPHYTGRARVKEIMRNRNRWYRRLWRWLTRPGGV